MKCIVLAGGAGNRLWPLSRKNYPKQFVNLKNGHSLFQETIVRNMPFCDEFWIFTSAAYRTIVEGQLQPIQGVMYRCFCEEEPHKTAPVLALAALLAQSEEDLLVVSTDNLIEGDYKTAIAQARAIAVSCADRNRDYAVRANASHIRAIADLLLGTNRPIMTCQGNTMDTGLRRYDGGVWLGPYFTNIVQQWA